MAVLIKGMEMPENCNKCPLSVNGYCVVSPKRANGDALSRHETTLWCPLVEVPTPHGRLIDADVLEATVQDLWMGNEISNSDWIGFRETLNSIPTIIEAED